MNIRPPMDAIFMYITIDFDAYIHDYKPYIHDYNFVYIKVHLPKARAAGG